MKAWHTIFFLAAIMSLTGLRLCGQADSVPPIPPVINLVSVDPWSGNVEIAWIPSPSDDVAGYIIYLDRDPEGATELDTLYSPSATSYTRTGSGSKYYSESFVVAAFDTADNVSPLSNKKNTIFSTAVTDTCNKLISISWNQYLAAPEEILSHKIMYSVDGSAFSELTSAGPAATGYVFDEFEVDRLYCFFVNANLTGGLVSRSNQVCVSTSMQRLPEWINADYATVGNDNVVRLSFTIDPLSETGDFILERRSSSSPDFTHIHTFSDTYNNIIYTDTEADIKKVNQYRLVAVNSCNMPSIVSNIASNIVLNSERNETIIRLTWNSYKEWRGYVSSYRIYVSTGGYPEERYTVTPPDTVYEIPYTTLMYEAEGDSICFMVRALEATNPLTVNGESTSMQACIGVEEKITVPDLFTPDHNSINDFFRPVLSFTPQSYRLIITDMNRRTVFETTDHNEEWDGTQGGNPLPGGTYLWFLRTVTPSGREITKTGIVAIIFNR
ncbi:MAG TPA: gliding motility-associated C-terminal domain-containing protein [Bacteroidales bacterium]|nr:gliding motility-associated C-terminal domain-containing protein [Bacteroidales bacterium]HRW85909.1 gliding motility-associated C-terminal domain-containing protein [Bacteroidales bacterium]